MPEHHLAAGRELTAARADSESIKYGVPAEPRAVARPCLSIETQSPPPPRLPKPGELLFEFVGGYDRRPIGCAFTANRSDGRRSS
jgi:hypothetical protein